MSITTILLTILSLYVIYVLCVYIFALNYIQKSITRDIKNGKDKMLYSGKLFTSSPFGAGARQTFSMWFYVKDLTYRYHNNKYIFTKMLGSNASLRIYVDKATADLKCDFLDSTTGKENNYKTVNMGTIDLKKWNHLVVVQDRNVIDVFVNGKIKLTTNEDTPVKTTIGENVIISDMGGFNGYTSNFQYYNYNANISEVRSLLEAGPLAMTWTHPLYYIYVALDYLKTINNGILTMYLPDPTKYVQDALKMVSIVPSVECKVDVEVSK